jgi:hypothetical protein
MFVKTQDMDRSVVTVKTYSKISYQKKITPRKLSNWENKNISNNFYLYNNFL